MFRVAPQQPRPFTYFGHDIMILNRYPTKEDFQTFAQSGNVIPVCAEILADTETPVSILQKFHSPDRALFLLESVEGGEHWARYSFMGLSAHADVKVFADTVTVESKNQPPRTFSHDGDPLGVLKKITEQYRPADIPALPRFWSGLTGYMTYEMVSFFEEIPISLPDDTPYAHFIIPDTMVIFDNMNHTLTCLSIAYIEDTEEKKVAETFDAASERLDKMIRTICSDAPFHGAKTVTASIGVSPSSAGAVMESTEVPSSTAGAVPGTAGASSPSPSENGSGHPPSAIGTSGIMTEETSFTLVSQTQKETYLERVQKIKDHIVAGDIIQAVYSQPFISTVPVDPVMLYRAQRYINPSPYMFFMNFGNLAIAGSSPETMVRLENRTATVRPIAGTRHRGETEQEDRRLADELLGDEKERAEHLMLVDLGRNDLGRVSEAGTVQVTDMMFVERYSHVMHLVSNITGEMQEGMDAWDLLRATFPAGTLSGAPKIRAMEIIADMEERPRGIYGGAAGYISFSGNMDLAITIRTAVMEDGIMKVQAGAGIVADSNPEMEYQECINKAKSVERAMKLAISAGKGGASCE